MKYMVFVIYVILIGQLLYSKSATKGTNIPRGRRFYCISTVANMIIGIAGTWAVNTFLRGKNIIPAAFVWGAIIAFTLMLIYSFYCAYKMIVSVEP